MFGLIVTEHMQEELIVELKLIKGFKKHCLLLMSFALIDLSLQLHYGKIWAGKRCREYYRKLDSKVSREAAILINRLF